MRLSFRQIFIPILTLIGVGLGTYGAFVSAAAEVSLPPINQLVLEQVRTMPQGGGYLNGGAASFKLEHSIGLDNAGEFKVDAGIAHPSFCSGATYLVFLKTLAALQSQKKLGLDKTALARLLVHGQTDGEGVWGRWNANGPGTARLFYELQLGHNFTDFNAALPGDFMKIFWNSSIGRHEHGHSVIYLGEEKRGSETYVHFWSSNLHVGFGEKSVPKRKIAFAVFSRLENPGNLGKAGALTADSYLAGLLRKDSSQAEMKSRCGY